MCVKNSETRCVDWHPKQQFCHVKTEKFKNHTQTKFKQKHCFSNPAAQTVLPGHRARWPSIGGFRRHRPVGFPASKMLLNVSRRNLWRSKHEFKVPARHWCLQQFFVWHFLKPTKSPFASLYFWWGPPSVLDRAPHAAVHYFQNLRLNRKQNGVDPNAKFKGHCMNTPHQHVHWLRCFGTSSSSWRVPRKVSRETYKNVSKLVIKPVTGCRNMGQNNKQTQTQTVWFFDLKKRRKNANETAATAKKFTTHTNADWRMPIQRRKQINMRNI